MCQKRLPSIPPSDHEFIVVNEPNVEPIEIMPTDQVEVLQSAPVDLESVLVISPQPERMGKRNVQRTSPLVSSQGNISRLVRNAEQKQQAENQKNLRAIKRLQAREQKLEVEAAKVAELRARTNLSSTQGQSEKENARGKFSASKKAPKRILQDVTNKNVCQNHSILREKTNSLFFRTSGAQRRANFL